MNEWLAKEFSDRTIDSISHQSLLQYDKRSTEDRILATLERQTLLLTRLEERVNQLSQKMDRQVILDAEEALEQMTNDQAVEQLPQNQQQRQAARQALDAQQFFQQWNQLHPDAQRRGQRDAPPEVVRNIRAADPDEPEPPSFGNAVALTVVLFLKLAPHKVRRFELVLGFQITLLFWIIAGRRGSNPLTYVILTLVVAHQLGFFSFCKWFWGQGFLERHVKGERITVQDALRPPVPAPARANGAPARAGWADTFLGGRIPRRQNGNNENGGLVGFLTNLGLVLATLVLSIFPMWQPQAPPPPPPPEPEEGAEEESHEEEGDDVPDLQDDEANE